MSEDEKKSGSGVSRRRFLTGTNQATGRTDRGSSHAAGRRQGSAGPT
jgi:hypothetical protein